MIAGGGGYQGGGSIGLFGDRQHGIQRAANFERERWLQGFELEENVTVGCAQTTTRIAGEVYEEPPSSRRAAVRTASIVIRGGTGSRQPGFLPAATQTQSAP